MNNESHQRECNGTDRCETNFASRCETDYKTETCEFNKKKKQQKKERTKKGARELPPLPPGEATSSSPTKRTTTLGQNVFGAKAVPLSPKCLPCICSVSSAQLFTLEPDNGLCAHMDVTSCDVTSATTQSSSVQVQCSVDGQAQTLLLTRVANPPPPANTMHSGKSRK